MKLQPQDQRVKRYLLRHLAAPVYRFPDIPDPRRSHGQRWPLPTLLTAILLGLVAGCRKLRDVEDLTNEMGQVGRRFVPRRVPDTTLQDLVVKLKAEPLRPLLWRQVKDLQRSKSLLPAGLPCGVGAIDGKVLATLDHDGNGQAQQAHRKDGSVYYLLRVLRAVLISAAARPALDQEVIDPKTNETGAFAVFFAQVVRIYGDLVEIWSVDAGMTSKDNADLIEKAVKGYVMGLKGNQPELFAEAQRLLLPLTAQKPEAQSQWERVKGKWLRRSLYRSAEIEGAKDWTHLRQVWLVRQETRSDRDKPGEIEDRYFLTNLRWGRLSGEQILILVRRHWAIENDCFWSLDARWGEDGAVWATGGHALEVLGVLGLMAYNLDQLCRKRHMRVHRAGAAEADPPSWEQIFRWVCQALRLELAAGEVPMPAD
jgi:hypothetical protein